jgi:hypothetical protein
MRTRTLKRDSALDRRMESLYGLNPFCMTGAGIGGQHTFSPVPPRVLP